jgi:hypothetical protein
MMVKRLQHLYNQLSLLTIIIVIMIKLIIMAIKVTEIKFILAMPDLKERW